MSAPDLYANALAIVREKGFVSVSMIQRRLRIGYNAAQDLAEQMMSRGDVDGLPRPPALNVPRVRGNTNNEKSRADMQPAPATEQATIAQAFAVDYPKPTASHTSVLMRHADHWQAYEKGWIAATQVERVQRSEDVLVFAIQVEKMLCAALGREWSTAGISIESLIAELTRRATASKAEAPEVELDADRWKFFVATLDEAEGNGVGANMTRIVDEAIAKAKVGMTALKAAIAATTKQGTP